MLGPSFQLVAVSTDVDILRLNLQLDGCHELCVVHCCLCRFVTRAIVTSNVTELLLNRRFPRIIFHGPMPCLLPWRLLALSFLEFHMYAFRKVCRWRTLAGGLACGDGSVVWMSSNVALKHVNAVQETANVALDPS